MVASRSGKAWSVSRARSLSTRIHDHEKLGDGDCAHGTRGYRSPGAVLEMIGGALAPLVGGGVQVRSGVMFYLKQYRTLVMDYNCVKLVQGAVFHVKRTTI